jgi:hypothetical protein
MLPGSEPEPPRWEAASNRLSYGTANGQQNHEIRVNIRFMEVSIDIENRSND